MNAWLAAVIALIPPLVLPIWIALSGRTVERLVAVQLAASVTALVLVLMSFAFDQSSFIDLPLTLAVLTLPGTLAFALFLERWL